MQQAYKQNITEQTEEFHIQSVIDISSYFAVY